MGSISGKKYYGILIIAKELNHKNILCCLYRYLLFLLWWTYSYLWWRTRFQKFKRTQIRNGSIFEPRFGCITTMIKMLFLCLSTFYQRCTLSCVSTAGFAKWCAYEEKEKLLASTKWQENLCKKRISIQNQIYLCEIKRYSKGRSTYIRYYII